MDYKSGNFLHTISLKMHSYHLLPLMIYLLLELTWKICDPLSVAILQRGQWRGGGLETPLKRIEESKGLRWSKDKVTSLVERPTLNVKIIKKGQKLVVHRTGYRREAGMCVWLEWQHSFWGRIRYIEKSSSPERWSYDMREKLGILQKWRRKRHHALR